MMKDCLKYTNYSMMVHCCSQCTHNRNIQYRYQVLCYITKFNVNEVIWKKNYTNYPFFYHRNHLNSIEFFFYRRTIAVELNAL